MQPYQCVKTICNELPEKSDENDLNEYGKMQTDGNCNKIDSFYLAETKSISRLQLLILCRSEIIVDGFMRNKNKEWRLFVPYAIIEIIKDNINKLVSTKFEHYNELKFTVTGSRTIITPMVDRLMLSKNHMIYPSRRGFTANTHIWSVKYLKHNGVDYHRSIGVTTNLNPEWIRYGIDSKWPTEDQNGSYYDGYCKE